MTCRLCAETSTHVTNADRRCAFGPDGRFRSENHLCATMSALLGFAPFQMTGAGVHAAFVTGPDGVVVLAWCGSVSQIEYAEVLVCMGETISMATLNLNFAEEIIAAKTRRPA